MKKSYDTTVARIAGNIASGFASKQDYRLSEHSTADGLREWIASSAMLSVGLARAIVAEVQRTEPTEEPQPQEPTTCPACGHKPHLASSCEWNKFSIDGCACTVGPAPEQSNG